MPKTIHTERTNGAVNVVTSKFIPTTCNIIERNTDNVANTIPVFDRSPIAIQQSTPLYPNIPVLNAK